MSIVQILNAEKYLVISVLLFTKIINNEIKLCN